jgi:predicted secreted hydrolase
MNKKIAYGLGFVFLCFIVIRIIPFPNDAEPDISSSFISGALITNKFNRANEIKPFEFPRDFGPHEDFQTEWWYYTGNLQDELGNRFGFQLTFFRRALLSSDMREERESDWGVQQIYFAHFALTDVSGKEFYNFERFSRDSINLAGASAIPYKIWLNNWSVEEVERGVYQLYAIAGEVELSLTLRDVKGPIAQGVDGYSQKGPEAGNASYYYSQTRLEVDGKIMIADKESSVTGLSWKDHEYSTSALSSGQVGWDWFSMQLDNDVEIMLFYLRREDGSIDQYSSGTLIYPDGTTEMYSAGDFKIEVTEFWRSPTTQTVYPAGWKINIPLSNIDLTITPLLANQELLASFVYWEGAVEITGSMGGAIVNGHGYIELTGYYKSMEGEF